MQQLVSVLICSYNAEAFIESTVNSVLGKTYKKIELLILDNASSDNTVQILKNIKKKDSRLVIFTKKENVGAYPGLNFLLDKAKGSYIAINDHDDIWHSEKLSKQISHLEKNRVYIGCGSAIINWYEEYHKGILRKQPKVYSIAWHTSLVFRNEGFRYDISKKVGTDFIFMQNILCKGGKKLYNFPEPYVFRRIWRGQKNLSSTWIKKINFFSIGLLNIPLFDKMALYGRKLLSASFVENAILYIFQRGDILEKNTMKKNKVVKEFIALAI